MTLGRGCWSKGTAVHEIGKFDITIHLTTCSILVNPIELPISISGDGIPRPTYNAVWLLCVVIGLLYR